MQKLKSLKNYLLSQVFFVFNTIGLTPPLAFTNFIALFGFKYCDNKKTGLLVILFWVIALFYFTFHFYYGVNYEYYLISTGYYFLLYLKNNKSDMSKSFRYSTYSVIALFIVALLLNTTSFRDFFWKSHDFGITEFLFTRYKGTGYEPSHIALVITPLFLYYFLKTTLFFKVKNLALLIGLSIILYSTISFGFLGAFIFSLLIVLTMLFIRKKGVNLYLFLTLILGGGVLVVFMLFENVFSERLIVILSGEDPSVNGRTWESFYLAYKCAAEKNVLTGIGPGQVKIIGEQVIRPYYLAMDPIGYKVENWPVLALPNAAAETLAIYGILGFCARIGLQIFLFFKMKVYKNYFNFFLFSFLFIYQLMGSFLTSTAEATLWVLCLIPIFSEFNINSKNVSN